MSRLRKPTSVGLTGDEISHYKNVCEYLDCSFSSLVRRALKHFTAAIKEEVEKGIPMRPGESKLDLNLTES